jgi:hypothetical protein
MPPKLQSFHLSQKCRTSKSLANDIQQLGVFQDEDTKYLKQLGFESILSYAADRSGTTKVQLSISYRGHPFLTECLRITAYGNKIEAGVTADQQRKFIGNFPLLAVNIPILIVRMKGEEKQHTLLLLHK